MKYITAFFFCALFLPCLAFADVKINEVSWMGTTTSQYNEWIELYNDGTNDVSLAGWKLYKTGDQPLFTLTKTIAAGGYLLVERTTASAPDAVPGISDESGTFSNGGLSNSGEDLTLKNDKGNTMDAATFASGWPAGDSTTKDTMQWDGSAWITAPSTPDAVNATTPAVAPSNATEDTADSTSVTTTSSSSTSTSKQSSSSSASTTAASKKAATASPAVVEPEISLTVSRAAFQGSPVLIDAAAKNVSSGQGYFYWNMGDGTTYVQSVLSPIQYTYHYAGSYMVSLAHFDSMTASRPTLQTMLPIMVNGVSLSLTPVDNDTALQITNNAAEPIDIGQWLVSTSEGECPLPPLTIVGPHAHITVAGALLGLRVIRNPSIFSPDHTKVGK